MATECQKDYSDEDQQMLDEAEGRECGLPAGVIEREMPAIHEAIQIRSLELLGENSDNLKERTERDLAKNQEPTDLQQIVRDTFPTQAQLHEMVVQAEKVRMSENEVISAPLICATPGVKGIEELIHDTLWAIENQQNIPYQHKDDQVFSKMVYVDAQSKGPTGAPSPSKFDPLTRTMFIFRNSDGDFPTKEELRDNIIPHEVFHAKRDEFLQRIREHEAEWTVAILSQGELPSKYAERLESLRHHGGIDRELFWEEVAAECCRKYAIGKCSPQMEKFIASHIFSEE